MWFTYCRSLRKHLKCHFLQIELNNWLVNMFQQSIKVSLIAVSVAQLIYLFLSRCCVWSFLPITLQGHPCPLGSQNYFHKHGYGWESRDPRLGFKVKKQVFKYFSPNFFPTRALKRCLEGWWNRQTQVGVSLASSMRLTMTMRSTFFKPREFPKKNWGKNEKNLFFYLWQSRVP